MPASGRRPCGSAAFLRTLPTVVWVERRVSRAAVGPDRWPDLGCVPGGVCKLGGTARGGGASFRPRSLRTGLLSPTYRMRGARQVADSDPRSRGSPDGTGAELEETRRPPAQT